MKQPMITALGALVALLETLSAPALAVADDDIKATLLGFEEPPAVSTVATGKFRGEINRDSIEYSLSYSGLEAPVRQAHIHLGQMDVNGGIVVFLCQTAAFPDPTGLAPICPQSGTVEGTITAANVIAVAAQGIAAGELDEVLRAIRRGVTYANVHSDKFPGGEIRGQIRADDDND
jgi:CHRD domain-containing protein